MLDTLLTLGFSECPKFQTKNKAYKNLEQSAIKNKLAERRKSAVTN
jgi:hypothetical protein